MRRSPGGDPNTQTSERRCGEKQQETRKPLIRRCPLSPPPVLGFQSSSPGNSHLCTKKKKKEETLTILRASSFSRSGFCKL